MHLTKIISFSIVPHILSSMIPPEDSTALITPDSSWSNSESDHQLISQHNEMMSQIIDQYNVRVGDFRSDIKSETVSKKRTFDKV
jgi:predicted glycosyl hydrolase (DUF1957 family)